MSRTHANFNALRERLSEIMGKQKDSFIGIEIPPLLAQLVLDDCPRCSVTKRATTNGAATSPGSSFLTGT